MADDDKAILAIRNRLNKPFLEKVELLNSISIDIFPDIASPYYFDDVSIEIQHRGITDEQNDEIVKRLSYPSDS